MKNVLNFRAQIMSILMTILLGFCCSITGWTQEEDKPDNRPVRPAFGSAWIMDNQSVVVNPVRTLEMDIMHRFGTVENGISDIFGIYAPSNIRIGLTYTVFKNLSVGLGTTKYNKLQDANIKYAIIQQTRSGKIPLSLTYYGNMALDARDKSNFRGEGTYFSDRLSYFHQLIIARKFGQRFALQLAPSYTHFNAVEEVESGLHKKNDHFALSLNTRLKFSATGSILFGVDQPLTKHRVNNPNPNINLGVEFVTSSHAFQIFAGNYTGIIPQYNHFFNSNNYWTEKESNNFLSRNFLLGFNITRLWGL